MNMTNGGEGVSGYKHTLETKSKISKGQKTRYILMNQEKK